VGPTDQILTAAQTRAAEDAAIAVGTSVGELMRRAGEGAAEWVWRIAAGHPVTVLCGPGNNGGDGYVIAEAIRKRGGTVCVVAALEPATDAAKAARAAYQGAFAGPDRVSGAVLVDCLFGTGLKRPLEAAMANLLAQLASAHRHFVAVDLPSGIDADTGALLARSLPPVDLTLALGALKPAHILSSAVKTCGEIRVIDLGLDLEASRARLVRRPNPPAVGTDSHKYNRGMVGVIAGQMPGAALLAATGAARAGAGYVAIFGDAPGGPASIVRRPQTRELLGDEKLGAVVVGPGLGNGAAARKVVGWLLEHDHLPLVIDADALHLVDRKKLAARTAPAVLTPHYGEFERMKARAGFTSDDTLDVLSRVRAEAEAAAPGVVLVLKGSTTYLRHGDDLRIAPRGNPWLSTAGTGDVLAGAIGAMLASYVKHGRSPLDAAEAGVWLHAEASRLLGSAFVADDLADALAAARASL
jgi:hydroxyethylthiazole kinase-like uncharacterized protein yjeF